MNREEAHEETLKIVEYVAVEFKDIFPDAFVHCTTDNPKIYQSSNPCMYSWHLKALNGILNLNFSPRYQQTDEQVMNSDWSCVRTFFVDMRHTDNFLKFLIENVKI